MQYSKYNENQQPRSLLMLRSIFTVCLLRKMCFENYIISLQTGDVTAIIIALSNKTVENNVLALCWHW